MSLTNDSERRVYHTVTNVPILWLEKGESLQLASEILLEEVENTNTPRSKMELGHKIVDPAYLLAGYALENFFKGIGIGKGIYEVDKENKFTGASHKLINIAKKIEFKLSKEETELLERLTIVIVWAGRYISPKGPIFLSDDIDAIESGSWNESWEKKSIPLLRALYKRAHDELETLCCSR